MPYLRITCPEMEAAARRTIAAQLTTRIVELFFNPCARLTREELRERTTVHFAQYGLDEMFIGGVPQEHLAADVTVELSDWSMSVRMQRRVAREIAPLLAEMFGVTAPDLDNVNIRFHSYPPTDFAVGGRLLSDVVPWIGRTLKRLSA